MSWFTVSVRKLQLIQAVLNNHTITVGLIVSVPRCTVKLLAESLHWCDLRRMTFGTGYSILIPDTITVVGGNKEERGTRAPHDRFCGTGRTLLAAAWLAGFGLGVCFVCLEVRKGCCMLHDAS